MGFTKIATANQSEKGNWTFTIDGKTYVLNVAYKTISLLTSDSVSPQKTLEKRLTEPATQTSQPENKCECGKVIKGNYKQCYQCYLKKKG